MLAVLLTAVVLLGGAAYFYSRFAVENLGEKVLRQASARIELRVERSLGIADEEAATLADLFASGWLDPHDIQRNSKYFLTSLQARTGLSYISFSLPDGTYYHAFRDRDDSLKTLSLVPNPDGRYRLRESLVGDDGSLTLTIDDPQSTHIPPFERPYYLEALEAGRPVWTESYIFLGSQGLPDIPGVSRAVPVFDPESSDLLGVITTDFDLQAISRFLSGSDFGLDSICFIIEIAPDGSPRVIAHPAAVDPDPARRLDLTEPSPDGEGPVTIRAESIADPRVTTLLPTLGSDLAAISNTVVPVEIEVDGEYYIGGYRHLGIENGPNWILCLLIPEETVFGDVRRMAHSMALLGLCGVAVAAVLSILLSRRISANLGHIARETREIGQFRLAAKQPPSSRILEVNILATAVEEMKTGLRSFQKYVPADLVRLLIESGQEAELGGTRRELTVYFSDIVGFTSLSEKLHPDKLVEILSRYLEAMTGEILRNDGTVDKYIGDAIMAFWGAPREHADHPLAACRAALQNQTHLAALREEWCRAGLPPLEARIGLHTGSATVGNFGSPNRLDYTAIGDTVNIASRLESLNRIYGTSILISETTRLAVEGHLITRPIDKVAVKGRDQGTLIHELVGEVDSVSPDDLAWIGQFTAALEKYFAADWASARDQFEQVLKIKPGDAAARLLHDRCQSYLATPPANDWGGIFQAPK